MRAVPWMLVFLLAGGLTVSGCGKAKPSLMPAADGAVIEQDGATAGDGSTASDGSAASDLPAGDGPTDAVLPPAFPGAQGWAATTRGGRGGEIIRVTTLAPSGPGSLSAALGVNRPRTIVFEVGGVIDMGGIRLTIRAPFLTIAGQTAPSPGITIIKSGIRIATHEVIIRHIRVRTGEAGRAKTSGWEEDAIGSDGGAYNIIIDHCSTTWGTDENLSASGPRFGGATPDDWRRSTSHTVTFSHNIVAEGLSVSTHSEGEHSKGGLIHDNVTEMAVIGTLYFSNMDRHPLFKGGARGVVVNNWVANPGAWAMRYNLVATEWMANPYQTGQMAIAGNVFTYGPSTPADVPLLRATGPGLVDIFFDDNIARKMDGTDAPLMGGPSVANVTVLPQPPVWPAGLVALPASSVVEFVRANVGARPWDRDEIDTRIVAQALAGQGAIINSEADVGGYPVHPETHAPFNPDEWDLDTMERKTAP